MQGRTAYHVFSNDGEIRHIAKNGQGALIDWYTQNNGEFNGAYITDIMYEPAQSTEVNKL